MRRFEYKKGTSSKFWQIELDLDKCQYTVKFGRIGAAGLFQCKAFGCKSAAQRDYDRMVHEKLKKGYVEVREDKSPVPVVPGQTAAAPPPVVAPGPNRRSIVI